jgi:glutathione synthase/RimK-type ligase-like ATP-grasp enzyme
MNPSPKKSGPLTLYIVIGLILGIACGFALNKNYVNKENDRIAAASETEKSVMADIHTYESSGDTMNPSFLQARERLEVCKKEKAEAVKAREG